MIISENVLDELVLSAGSTRTQKANNYVEDGNVNITKVVYENKENFAIRSKVREHGEIYNVYLQVSDGEILDLSCTCEDYHTHYGTCKHILATALEFEKNKSYIRIFSGENSKTISDININKKNNNREEKYRNFKQLINTFYPINNKKENETRNIVFPHNVKLEPILIYNSYLKTLKLEAKIGNTQMYKIKNFSEFYDRMQNKEHYRYGAKLEFVHDKEMFDEQSIPLLEFILKYSEIIKYANERTDTYSYYAKPMEERYIKISNTGMDDLFEVLQNREVIFQKDGMENKVLFLKQEPDIKFNVKEKGTNEYILKPNFDIYNYEIIDGRNNIYFKQGQYIYQCSENFKQTTLKLLQVFRNNFTNEIVFPKEEMSQLFSIVFPKLKEKIETSDLKQEEIEKYIPKVLSVKVFLDFNELNFITAEIKFVYDEYEFNPFIEKNIDIPRDIAKEDEVLEMFRKTGFMIDAKNAILVLTNEDAIFEFLEKDIETYMKKFEVLATDNFKQREIRNPKIGTLGVRIENNLLNIDLSNVDFEIDELKEIMNKYHLRKKYHRLKDGSFLNLDKNDTLDFIESISEGMDINYKELEKGQIRLPVYRGLYLDKLLETFKNTNITKNEEYQDLVNKIENRNFTANIIIPENLNAELRSYQKIGYEWLEVLDSYKFGGILADDMGLRKNYSNNFSYIKICAK